MILSVRTDKPEAELGLFSTTGERVDYSRWQAHRELSSTLHSRVEQMLRDNQVDWPAITRVVFYSGPGSFTGLRIGAAFVNALDRPVVSVSGDDWLSAGLQLLEAGQAASAAITYGEPARTTKPKK